MWVNLRHKAGGSLLPSHLESENSQHDTLTLPRNCSVRPRHPACPAGQCGAGQLCPALPAGGQAGLPAPAGRQRRAGGLAAGLGRGRPARHHRPPRRISLRLSRRLEGPGGPGQRHGPRRHRLAAGTVLLLARRRDPAGPDSARRVAHQENPRPVGPHRRGREQGRSRRHLHLLEERLQAPGLQQLGPFADGPRPGGPLPGHRR